MKKHLNTLYITTDNTWLSKDGDTIKIQLDGQCLGRFPLHNIQGIISFGWNILVSPQLMEACLVQGIHITFCNPYGKFLATVQGNFKGNVLLRRSQYRLADNEELHVPIAREMIAAKIANCRTLLMRVARTYDMSAKMQGAIDQLKSYVRMARKNQVLDQLRGIEGTAADVYFKVFDFCLVNQDPNIHFTQRQRRPPQDPVNALLSFLYTLLSHDARSALASVGLDPDVGFLHRDRPGRHSLALDLMEEFRAPMADRLVLTLLNRKQLKCNDFEIQDNGAVLLKEESRKIVLQAWQERKSQTIDHPFLNEKVTVGFLMHIQAQILAKTIRGEMNEYVPYIWK